MKQFNAIIRNGAPHKHAANVFNIYGFPPEFVGKFFKIEVSDTVIFMQEEKLRPGQSKKNGFSRVINYKTQKAEPTVYLRGRDNHNAPRAGSWSFNYEENASDGTVKVYGVFSETQEGWIGGRPQIKRGVERRKYVAVDWGHPGPETVFQRILRFFGFAS